MHPQEGSCFIFILGAFNWRLERQAQRRDNFFFFNTQYTCVNLTRGGLGLRSHQQLPDLPMERHQSLVLRCGGTLKTDGTQSCGTHLVPRTLFIRGTSFFSAVFLAPQMCD